MSSRCKKKHAGTTDLIFAPVVLPQFASGENKPEKNFSFLAAKSCAAFVFQPRRRRTPQQYLLTSGRPSHVKLGFFDKSDLPFSARSRKFPVTQARAFCCRTFPRPASETMPLLALSLPAKRHRGFQTHDYRMPSRSKNAQKRATDAPLPQDSTRRHRVCRQIKKESRHTVTTPKWSGRLDLNQRLSAPKADALPLRHAPKIKNAALKRTQGSRKSAETSGR